MRLRLVIPQPGVDPALKPALERDSILLFSSTKLKPEQQVILLLVITCHIYIIPEVSSTTKVNSNIQKLTKRKQGGQLTPFNAQ